MRSGAEGSLQDGHGLSDPRRRWRNGAQHPVAGSYGTFCRTRIPGWVNGPATTARCDREQIRDTASTPGSTSLVGPAATQHRLALTEPEC
ncbi:hypothetical protein RAJCM14343_2690 [Rhodococcus aetherivorans]|uniref:Uncharacterized protein n=1 Tax=Rhodococcus aetherivorans TaxID=191292 RepID=A0ABQ0YLI9_9NOCA|nr:hypothetical protein RAJCM14343_2690 [Rhodococcus aetherivorans]